MEIGFIGYESHSGLGHLMRDFFDNGIVNRVLVVRHPRDQNYADWYPPAVRYTKDRCEPFLRGLDVLLLFENAFLWDVASLARQHGTRIVMIPNYEFTPFPSPVAPNLVLCPSSLDVDYYADQHRTMLLPIPLDTNKIPGRRAAAPACPSTMWDTAAMTGGTEHPGCSKRCSTSRVPYVSSSAAETGEPRVRQLFERGWDDPRVTLRYGDVAERGDLWSEGDVYVAPERYNGVSLPLQEAFGWGMLVMTTDRYPMNTWLPTEPMIPVDRYESYHLAVDFERAVIEPRAIAAMIDQWYGRDISRFSEQGRRWAAEHNWDVMRPKYLDILQGL